MVITTFNGSSTAITAGTFAFRSCLSKCSSSEKSTMDCVRTIPISSTKRLILSGVKPLLRSPRRVGSLGSSQPATWFPATSWRR
ncbi:hypothetical protein D3C73_1459310 [compost metagenome]